ncbi:MAG: GntR family transcriptional regulator [Rhodobacter sp.]|nr:GntR family transcriptional regulator [Rhodobacter sp.]
MPQEARQTRVGDAYERLKEEIRTNRMPPGFQAPEPEIAVRLGMSRTPVREALIRLEAEGLVELVPRRGARVLPIRADDMREIYEILTALEPEAAASLAARGPSAKELAPLEEATTDMELALEQNDLDAWAEADDRFHRLLLDLHGNRRLQAFVVTLFDQAHRARIITLRMRGTPLKSTTEHRRILEHLRDGDAEATRQAFRAHRQRAAEELLGILEKYKLGQL